VTSAPTPGWLSTLAGRLDEIDLVFPRSVVPPEGGRRSAVLILFGPSAAPRADGADGVDVLLTQRSDGLRSHAGQVAFPGGAVDPGDAGPEAAALRESWEETGLDADGVEVLGALPELYLPPSGYVVTPVLAWWARPSAVGPVDPAEVAHVVRVPLSELLDPANRFSVRHPSGYVGPAFAAGGLFVWGFTAGLLARILAEAGLEQPWDTKVYRPLPELRVAATEPSEPSDVGLA
jgi:8-oxo-dGTP pyrophosphatase MutT (NUDIX family)